MTRRQFSRRDSSSLTIARHLSGDGPKQLGEPSDDAASSCRVDDFSETKSYVEPPPPNWKGWMSSFSVGPPPDGIFVETISKMKSDQVSTSLVLFPWCWSRRDQLKVNAHPSFFFAPLVHHLWGKVAPSIFWLWCIIRKYPSGISIMKGHDTGPSLPKEDVMGRAQGTRVFLKTSQIW